MIINYNLDQILDLVTKLKLELVGEKNIVVFFDAQMGAGKTTLIKAFIESFDDSFNVTSPTFIGMNSYKSSDLDFYHYDLYQVALNLEELDDILKEEKKKILFFEWSSELEENTKTFITNSNSKCFQVKINIPDDDSREFILQAL